MLNSEIPNRPKRLISEFVQTDDAWIVTYRPRRQNSWFASYFLILFWMIWTAFCVELAFEILDKLDLCLLVFALPFWAISCCLLAALIYNFFGFERLAISAEGIGYEHRIFLVFPNKRFLPRQEILAIESSAVSTDSDDGSKTFAVEIVTTGRKQLYGKGLSELECQWVAHSILAALKLFAVVEVDSALVTHSDPPLNKNLPIECPSDCDWKLEDNDRTLNWRNASRLNWSGISVLLFINVFWNSLVSLGVAHLAGGMLTNDPQKGQQEAGWWWALVIMIPIGLIGLAMFVGLLFAVADVFRRTVWTFGLGTVESHHRWLIFTRTQHFKVDSNCRLLARETAQIPKKLNKPTEQTPPADDRFELAIVNTDDVAICSMTGLTIGEARWMKAEIESRRPGWFRV